MNEDLSKVSDTLHVHLHIIAYCTHYYMYINDNNNNCEVKCISSMLVYVSSHLWVWWGCGLYYVLCYNYCLVVFAVCVCVGNCLCCVLYL